jgi:O-antigen/teichoic acid export membrane protein
MIRISKGFLKNSLIYTLAGALPMASAIILLPFYISYLSIENFGAQSIYLAFSVLVQILTTYSFDTGLYVYYHSYKDETENLKTFISSSFIFMALLGFGIAIFFVISGDFLADYFFSERGLAFYPYGLMALITGIFQSAFKVHSSLLQSSERPDLFFWSNLLSFSLIAIFTIIGLEQYPNTLIGPVGGRMAAAIVSGGWAFSRVFFIYGIKFDFQILKSSFSFNNSSFIYQLQQWSMNYFDRFIMVFYLPLAAIGVYDFAVKCMLAVDLVMSGLYNSFYPKVIGTVMKQSEKESTIEINRYYHGFTAITMILVCLSIAFFSIILDSGFIRSGYEASKLYIPFIGILYLIRVSRYYFAFPYGALKFSKPLPVIYLIISLVKIVLIVTLINYYEVYAVIAAALVSTILEIYLLRSFIKDKFKFKFNYIKLIAAPTVLAILIGLTEALSPFHQYARYSFYLIFCLVVLIWLYRTELKILIRNVRQ